MYMYVCTREYINIYTYVNIFIYDIAYLTAICANKHTPMCKYIYLFLIFPMKTFNWSFLFIYFI